MFFIFDMGVPGVIFIKLVDWMRPHVDVKLIGTEIIKSVKETGQCSARFVCRLIPVDVLCKANNFEDFKMFADIGIKKYFREAELVNPATLTRIPWCMEFKRRNNDKIQRRDYQDFLCT